MAQIGDHGRSNVCLNHGCGCSHGSGGILRRLIVRKPDSQLTALHLRTFRDLLVLECLGGRQGFQVVVIAATQVKMNVLAVTYGNGQMK